MLPIFEAGGVHPDAMAALLLFQQAAEAEEVTVDLVDQVAVSVRRAHGRTVLEAFRKNLKGSKSFSRASDRFRRLPENFWTVQKISGRLRKISGALQKFFQGFGSARKPSGSPRKPWPSFLIVVWGSRKGARGPHAPWSGGLRLLRLRRRSGGFRVRRLGCRLHRPEAAAERLHPELDQHFERVPKRSRAPFRRKAARASPSRRACRSLCPTSCLFAVRALYSVLRPFACWSRFASRAAGSARYGKLGRVGSQGGQELDPAVEGVQVFRDLGHTVFLSLSLRRHPGAGIGAACFVNVHTVADNLSFIKRRLDNLGTFGDRIHNQGRELCARARTGRLPPPSEQEVGREARMILG